MAGDAPGPVVERDGLRLQEIDPQAYIAHWCGDTWTGDACGCVDDRCIGHHHDHSDREPCSCLVAWVDDFMANVPVRGWNAPTVGATPTAETGRQPSPTAGGERPARVGELCSCGRPAVTVFETAQFGDVAYCGIPDGGAR